MEISQRSSVGLVELDTLFILQKCQNNHGKFLELSEYGGGGTS
jgi:hypothetical protein